MVGSWGRAAPPAPAAVHASGPPAGHTGGFGEPTCQQCHTEFDLNALGGRLELEGLPEAYEPGRSYAVLLTLHSDQMQSAGFQLSARFDDGAPAGKLAPVDARVAVVDSTGVPYAQHTAGGTVPETPELARWTLEWVAPSGGRVVFHAAANSANGDSSPFGDLIYTTERRVAVPGG